MAILLCDTSAQLYWRLAGTSLPIPQRVSESDVARRFDGCDAFVYDDSLVVEHVRDRSGRVCVMVPRPERRRRAAGICCSVWTAQLPPGSLYRGAPGVYVCSPELAFLQTAAHSSLLEAIDYGYELCGTYALGIPDLTPLGQREAPLVSPRDLRRLLDFADGRRGVERAGKALAHVIENSASPRESILAMMLELPRSMGGYGFGDLELNAAIAIPNNLRHLSRHAHFMPDLFWREAKLAVEYDSDEFHTGRSNIAHDSRRRNILHAMGIMVISFTNEQITSEQEVDRIASLIARRLGVRRRGSVRNLEIRRADLHRSLLDMHRCGR